MRGTHGSLDPAVFGRGIIPADAGNTIRKNGRKGAKEDHPRGCREHADAGIYTVSVWGSSPRMRGARGRSRGRVPGVGIIPADAGSTEVWKRVSSVTTDHPRGCREHVTDKGRVDVAAGSSPRMQGARRPGRRLLPAGGIIPADAGSTHQPCGRHNIIGDHPRGCREHRRFGYKELEPRGSSPRMRGAPTKQYTRGQRMRIIPADAGSTSKYWLMLY